MKNYQQAIVVIIKTPKGYVLTKKAGEDLSSNSWLFPGGYVKQFERLETAVRREMKEEFNLIIEFMTYLSNRFDCSRRLYIHYFYVTTTKQELKPQSDVAYMRYANSEEIQFLYDKKHLAEWPLDLKTLFLEHFEYLLPTRFCDSTNSEIKNIARDSVFRYKQEKEIAINLFHFVRDYITYRLGDWQKTSSQTLRRGSGTCTNKANLLVALLRASGIPAGYGILTVSAAEYFGPIVIKQLKRNVSLRSKHIYCYVYLNGNWIKCDPSDDIELSLSTQDFNEPSSVVNFDGENHAMLQISDKHIIEDKGPYANIDSIIEKKQRRIMKLPVSIGNHYIRFLRSDGLQLQNLNEMENKFLSWMKNKKLIHYLISKMYFIIRKHF
jgi:ADP-ribose pyrophosphatase YjhB (NUDIX family)